MTLGTEDSGDQLITKAKVYFEQDLPGRPLSARPAAPSTPQQESELSSSGQRPRPFSARDAKITRKAPLPSFRKASPTSADDGVHRPRKKAAEAAQQLWYEWSAENLENMSKAAQRRRLGPDAQKAIINEAETARLVKQAEKMKEMSDARLAQCAEFWQECPKNTEKSKTKVIENARKVARNAVTHQLLEENLQAEVDKLRKEGEEASKENQRTIFALTRENEALRERSAQAEEAAARAALEDRELRDTISLLQDKLQAAGDREVEHQRKLRVFTRLDPIFSSLAEQFNFDSPDEVLNRLEFLEAAQMQSVDRINQFEEENMGLKKKLDAALQEASSARTALAVEEDRRRREAETNSGEHVEEMRKLHETMQRMKDKEADNLNLQSAVADLWTRCVNTSELVRATDNEEEFRLHKPLEMVLSLQELLLMHAPTMAGKKHHELQAFANRVWRIHFEARPALKNKTLEIYEALHELTEQSLAQIEALSRECNECKSQIKRAKSTEEMAVRKMKRMEAYHQKVMEEKKEVLSKPRVPDPSVLHHGLPAQQRSLASRAAPLAEAAPIPEEESPKKERRRAEGSPAKQRPRPYSALAQLDREANQVAEKMKSQLSRGPRPASAVGLPQLNLDALKDQAAATTSSGDKGKRPLVRPKTALPSRRR